MEEAEYNKKLQQINVDYESAKRALYQEYGLSKAIYKVGDIINDTIRTMLIDKITVSVSFGVVDPVYHGFELRKDLTPKKSGERGSTYGNNDTKLIKVVNGE